MMRKQNVQNVHDKGCSNQGKHETFKREDKREMKEKPTKAKKKGRTIRAFKRDISLWLFCVPGVILTSDTPDEAVGKCLEGPLQQGESD